jgi:hypothetical protein
MAAVYPPGSTFAGKTIGEWSAEWWKLALAIPSVGNPIQSDPDGRFSAVGDAGPLFYLFGNWGGVTHRFVRVPCGKPLFFPVVNDIEWVPQGCNDCPSCKALSNFDACSIDCRVDGVDVSDLSGLTGLEELWLCSNQINDVSGLSGLTSLRRLGLDYVDIYHHHGVWVKETALYEPV